MSEDAAGKGAELTLKLTTTVVCKALCSSFTNFFGLEENVHKQHCKYNLLPALYLQCCLCTFSQYSLWHCQEQYITNLLGLS